MEGWLYCRDQQTVKKMWFQLNGYKIVQYTSPSREEAYTDAINLLDVLSLNPGPDTSPGFSIDMESGVKYVLEAENVEEKGQWVTHLADTLLLVHQIKERKRAKEAKEERMRRKAEKKARREARMARRQAREVRRAEALAVVQRAEEERIARAAEARRNQIKASLDEERKRNAIARAESAIAYVQTGVDLLKYIFRGGAPHERHFAITPDRNQIKWGNKGGKLDRSIWIETVEAVLPGVATHCLKEAVSDASKADLYFSVVTKDRTLDCGCYSKEIRDRWVTAVQYIRFGLQPVLATEPLPVYPTVEEITEQMRAQSAVLRGDADALAHAMQAMSLQVSDDEPDSSSDESESDGSDAS